MRKIETMLRAAAFAPLVATAPLTALAQVTLKPDNQWRYLFTAGANASSGNSSSSSLNLGGEAARLSDHDKWTFLGQAAHARNAGVTTTERFALGTQYNRDLSPHWFGFGSGDTLRDEPANLQSRYSVAAGLGHHVIRREDNSFDLSAGLGYTRDQFVAPSFVKGRQRDGYGRAEWVLAEESNHTLTSTTSLRQRLSILPSLRGSGDYRAMFDTNITVAMTESLNLTAGLSYRFNSDPGVGLKKTDLTFVTGISLRFD